MSKLLPFLRAGSGWDRWTPAKAYTTFYVAQFLFLGVYLPFFPGWLDQRGFTPEAIGALTGAALVIRLLLAPPMAYRAESLADPRAGVRLTALFLAVLTLSYLAPVPNFVIALVGIAVWFSFGLLVPLSDTAVLRADRRGELNYGISRGIGSASFIVASLVGGALIAQYGDQTIVLWAACATAGILAASWALPREPSIAPGEKRSRPSLAFALGLFRSKSFLLMLFASGLCQGAHATYYAFSELHWSALGYSSLTIGCLWAVGVAAEIVFLAYARPIARKFGAPLLIAAGTLAALVRWPLTGLSPPLAVLFCLQILHAFTFASAYMGSIEFIDRAVPSAYRTTAMTLVSALGVGAMTGLATVLVGTIFDRNDPFLSYAVMGAMGGVGTGLAVWLYRRWDGGPLKAVPASAS